MASRFRFSGAHSPSASDSGEPLATLRRVMTPSTPWGNERGQLPQRLRLGSQIVGRRQARRLSRRFARVGITTPPDRLRQMLAGAPAAYAEVADFKFALIATRFKRDQFRARVRRMKRRGARTLIFVGMVLVTLNFLFCYGLGHVQSDARGPATLRSSSLGNVAAASSRISSRSAANRKPNWIAASSDAVNRSR